MYWKTFASAAVGLCLSAGPLLASELRVDGAVLGNADGIVRFEANYESRQIIITTDGSVGFSRIDENQDPVTSGQALTVQVINPAQPNVILSTTQVGHSRLINYFLVNNQNDNVRIKTNGNLKVEKITTPVIESFSASADAIVVGDSVDLSWVSTDTETCNIEGSETIEDLPGSGTETVTPASTGQKSYTLTCTDTRGASVSSDPLFLSVSNNPPVSLDFSASANEITQGDSVLLQWNTENATSCTGTGPGFSGSRDTNGSLSVTPDTVGTNNYSMTCEGEGAPATKSLAIEVLEDENPGITGLCDDIDVTGTEGFDIVCFEATAEVINQGEPITISWAATGSNFCQGTANLTFLNSEVGDGTRVPVKGHHTFNETRTGVLNYGLKCTGATGGTLTEVINVNSVSGGGNPNAPKIRTFASTATTVLLGDSYTLNWDAINVNSCTAAGSWSGDRPVFGSQEFTGDALGERTYTLNCTNGSSTVTRSVDVDVVEQGSSGNNPGPLGIITSFTSSTVTATVGQPFTLSWTTDGAFQCKGRSPILEGWSSGILAANGSANIQLNAPGTYTFRLDCFENNAGTVITDTSYLEIEATGTALPPVATNLTVNTTTITDGQSVVFTYNSSNATSCEKIGNAPGWAGNLSGTSGTINFTPQHDSMALSYGVRCSNQTSNDTASVNIHSQLPPQQLNGNCPVPYETLQNRTWAETFGSVWPNPASWNEMLQINRGLGWAISFNTGAVGTSGSIVSAPITGGAYSRMGSFSQCPGDYTYVEADCVQLWTEGQRLNFEVSTNVVENNNKCELEPNSQYFFNVRYSSACTSSVCRGIFDYDLN